MAAGVGAQLHFKRGKGEWITTAPCPQVHLSMAGSQLQLCAADVQLTVLMGRHGSHIVSTHVVRRRLGMALVLGSAPGHDCARRLEMRIEVLLEIVVADWRFIFNVPVVSDATTSR